MKKINFTFLLGFIVGLLNAQTFDSTAWKYAKTITAEDLNKHLKVIASDDFEGRETGKEGQKKAMKYLVEQFKSYDIKDHNQMNYIQTFPLIEQKNEGIALKINGKNFNLNEDFVFSPSIYEDHRWDGNLYFVGYGIEEEKYNDYSNLNIKDKAVFIWNGTPDQVKLDRTWTLKKKIELAKEKGAAIIFVYNDKLEENLIKFEHFYNKPKTKLASENEFETPIIHLTQKPTEAFLKSGKTSVKKVEKKGLKKVENFSAEFELTVNKPTQKLTGENVIAYIEGSDKKDELLVLTAHYDHIGIDDTLIYNGADDDGSGTVTLLEIAEAFSKAIDAGYRPKRSILIMPVSGEEKGLLGSKYYTNHPVFPLSNTVANLNIDMIGRYDEKHKEDSNYVYLIGSDKLSTDLHELSEKVNETYLNIGLDYTFNNEKDPNRFYYRSDHYNFAKNGIPVIFYFSGVHEDYHKPTDTIEKIDFQKTERIARLIFLTAWEIANRESRIKLN